MQGSAGILWALAVLGIAGTGLMVAVWRGERVRHAAAQAELQRLADEIESGRRTAETAQRAGRGHAEELAELRRKLEKARKRAFVAQQEREPLAARIAELETTLTDRERVATELRRQLESFAEEREHTGRELARLGEELTGARRAAAGARIDPGAHGLLQQRVEAAESEVRRLQTLLREAEHEASRWRQRERVQRRSYTVLRGELEIAKDHLRALRGDGAIEVDDGAAAALRSDGGPDAQSTRSDPV
jgi:chromosome segregation ATPase